MRDWRPCILPFLSFALPVCAQTPQTGIGIIEGDVINASTGAPIAGARVKIDRGPGADPVFAKAGADGHFVFENFAPPAHMITAESPGFLRSMTYLPGRGSYRTSVASANDGPKVEVDLSIDADGTSHVKLSIPLLAYAVITGRVTDPEGLPIEGSSIEVLLKRPITPGVHPGRPGHPLPDGQNEVVSVNGTQVQTNDKGEYRAALLMPGTYYLGVNRSNSLFAWERAYHVTYFPNAVDFGSAKPVVLAAGQQFRADIQVVRIAGVRVSGKLIKPQGPDVPNGKFLFTQILLAPEQTYVTNANAPFTNANGDNFEFTAVPPGRYLLQAMTRDASTNPFGDEKAVFGFTREIEVADRDMDGVDLTLQPVRDVSGTVTFGEGCRTTPMQITIPFSMRASWMHGNIAVDTDADGRFVLHGLSSGRFTIQVIDPVTRVPATVKWIRLGERDVLKEGFEAPLTSDDPLRIEVDCARTRGQR